MSKIIFLDIDGTLVDFQMRMPESAGKALRLAQQNGHKIIICTGRTYTNIYPWLLEFGFDGYVASAGAYIKAGEEVIYHRTLEADKLRSLVEILERHGASYMFQGIHGRYVSEECRRKMEIRFEKQGLDPEAAFREMITVEDPLAMPDLESGMYFGADILIGEMQKEVGDEIKITGCSFGEDIAYTGEINCMGINKATGMKQLMEHMQIPWENSVAIGDGPNDVEMLDYANVGIAMGNATEELKRHADMITSPIDQDGVYYALKKLQLI